MARVLIQCKEMKNTVSLKHPAKH